MSNNDHQDLNAFKGERGIPGVNDAGSRTGLSSGTKVMIIGLILLLCVGGALVYLKHKRKVAHDKELAQQQRAMQVQKNTKTFELPPTPPETAEATPQPPAAPVIVTVPAASQPAKTPPPVPSEDPGTLIDRSASELMASGGQGSSSSGQHNAHPQSDGNHNEGNILTGTGNNGTMHALLTATNTASRTAGQIGDRNFILAKGSFIDCALQTKLDSTVPGMTACVVTRNIYSDNGKVLLIERGSTVSGEYQSNMKQGQARIFVLWTRIKTPNGIIVNLDSPGADPLGGSGLPGWIDTHFWERFGGALMLSIVGDVSRYLTTVSANNNSGNISFQDTSSATREMAAEALRNTINIPPTLYKNQGEQVGIYVARDLDFSKVYDVRTNNNR